MVSSSSSVVASAARRVRVVVWGGSGYVGSAIARALVRHGDDAPSSSSVKSEVDVVCASRGGRAPAWATRDDWSARVKWVAGDALDAQACERVNAGADVVVTAIGVLPFPWMSSEDIIKYNAETNVTPGRAAMATGASRLVVVGASIPPFVPGLASYAKGKAIVEACARDEFASTVSTNGDETQHGQRRRRRAVVLKPAAVSGTRRAGALSIPLWAALDPARKVLRLVGNSAIMANAPVLLENVARAAARAALEDAYGDAGFTIIGNESLIEDFSS